MDFQKMDLDDLVSRMGKGFSSHLEEAENMSYFSQVMGILFGRCTFGISSDIFHEIKECTEMLERYVPLFPMERSCAKFREADMKRWKEIYYPDLVLHGPRLEDDVFFSGRDTPSHFGIGTDGEFTGYELFQFLYRLQRTIVGFELMSLGGDGFQKFVSVSDLLGCAEMLEQYVSHFPKESGCVTFEKGDMERWKSKYYPALVLNGPKLLDNKFFSSSDMSSHLGIGTDGAFTGYELFQFMYRLYKEIASKIV